MFLGAGTRLTWLLLLWTVKPQMFPFCYLSLGKGVCGGGVCWVLGSFGFLVCFFFFPRLSYSSLLLHPVLSEWSIIWWPVQTPLRLEMRVWTLLHSQKGKLYKGHTLLLLAFKREEWALLNLLLKKVQAPTFTKRPKVDGETFLSWVNI